jgi:hypothetical protein
MSNLRYGAADDLWKMRKDLHSLAVAGSGASYFAGAYTIPN